MTPFFLPHHCREFAGAFFPRWELPIPRLEKKFYTNGIPSLAQICIPALLSNKAVGHCTVRHAPQKAPTLSPVLDIWCACLLTTLCGGMIWFCQEAEAHQQPHSSPPHFAFWTSVCLWCAVVILYGKCLKKHREGISRSSKVFKGNFLGRWKYGGRENTIFLSFQMNFYFPWNPCEFQSLW